MNPSFRDTHLELENLEAGEYYVFAELCDSSNAFTITAYGVGNYDFCGDESSKFEKIKILSDVFKSKALQGGEDVLLDNYSAVAKVKRYQYVNDVTEGYLFVYIDNADPAEAYRERCDFNDFKNLELLGQFSGNNYDVTVPPGKEQMILIRVVGDGIYEIDWERKHKFEYYEALTQ